jgi:hypothetical protein
VAFLLVVFLAVFFTAFFLFFVAILGIRQRLFYFSVSENKDFLKIGSGCRPFYF